MEYEFLQELIISQFRQKLREASAIDGANENSAFFSKIYDAGYVNQSLQYWHCGHLSECGIATLMR